MEKRVEGEPGLRLRQYPEYSSLDHKYSVQDSALTLRYRPRVQPRLPSAHQHYTPPIAGYTGLPGGERLLLLSAAG